MKSKYDSILKVRKQQLDKAQTHLSEAQQRLKENEKLCELSRLEYKTLKTLPSNGGINELKSNLTMSNVAREALLRAKEKLELSQKEIVHYEFLCQKANLNYEKVKALNNEEIKKRQKEIQRNEQNFLDEIANTRFFKKDKNV